MGNGIGCHTMSMLMDAGQSGIVTGLTQMGGEGAQWIGQQPYVDANHAFQNLGDGTLSHSGLLAIRASIAAGTNITYKILYNAAVAMTGGQDAVGGYAVPQLTQTLTAEGVKRITITTDHPEHYDGIDLPAIASVRDRADLPAVQQELREIAGTTILIHDQPCAAELRRKRKRGKAAQPKVRVVINERLCEGCGDCGKKSNCLSVMPVQTEFGRKTQIHQSSCNSDYTCVNGDCPSFMEVIPDPKATKAKANRAPAMEGQAFPAPDCAFDADGFTLRITGIGGTGIVTVAQVLATAAFLDGLHPLGLDQVGLSQKAGPVVSDVKFTRGNRPLSPKVNTAACDLYLGCDVLVAGDAGNLAVTRADRTIAIISTADVPSGSMIRSPDTAFPDKRPIAAAIDSRTRANRNAYIDAQRLSEALFGSDQFANMLLVGSAFQAGALPLTEDGIERAIALNGVAIEANLQAFRRGRQAIADPSAIATTIRDLRPKPAPQAQPVGAAATLIASIGAQPSTTFSHTVTIRVPDLIEYQNERYAQRYADLVAKTRAAEQAAVPGNDALACAVADNLYKLMAYKDEYEVARLALNQGERAKIASQYGEHAKIVWKLHPPALRALGLQRKLSLGRWFSVFYVLLRAAKWLRGTKLDLFGYAEVRKVERNLIEEYIGLVDALLGSLSPSNHALAVRIAALPDLVRGYEQIKLDNVQTYHTQLAELRAQYR